MNWFKKPTPHTGESFSAPGPLHAGTLRITMAVLCRVEEIVGADKLLEVLSKQQANITVAQKRQLLTDVLGYLPSEADALSPVEFDAEMSCFFTRWLAMSSAGTQLSSRAAFSNIDLPQMIQNIITSRTSSRGATGL